MLDLYKNIKNKRIELGMTQSDLAQRMGYADKSMIAKIEKGSVDLPQSKIIAFAEALNTTPAYLMGWTDTNVSSDVNYEVHIEVDANTPDDAIYSAVKALLRTNGDASRSESITKEEAVELFKSSGFKIVSRQQNPLQPQTIAAHFDGTEYTKEQLERIKAFASFIKTEDKNN